jgi:uncharacterized membrane protein YjjP (DUF1212 family)
MDARMTTETVLERISIRSLVDLLKEVCRVAIECGCSSNRVETLVIRLSEAWGFQVDVAALPTAVWLSVKGRGLHIMELVRVRTWSINLERLSRLNDLVDEVENKKILLEEAVERLQMLSQVDGPYPEWLRYVAGGGTSVALIYVFEGSAAEMCAGFALGLICQTVSRYFSVENRRFLAEFFAGMLVALVAAGLHYLWPNLTMPRMILGGLISMFPGLVFVNAMHEVAQKNLSSGAARLLEACMIAVSLAFGVASSIGFVHYAARYLTH